MRESDAPAETFTGVVLSFVLVPGSAIPLGNGEDARAYARRHLVPLLPREGIN
jgi:hypothetical protein